MKNIYFIQINLTNIILLLLIWYQTKRKTEQLSTELIIFKQMLWATVLLSFSDMIAGIVRGRFFTGDIFVLEISNLLYFITMVVVGYLWMLYIDCRLHRTTKHRIKRCILQAIPLMIFSIIALTNPFTHILFKFNDNHLYERNFGVFLHWVVAWSYLIIPTIKVLISIIKEKNKLKRNELFPLLFFLVPPFITSLIQMNIYGVSVTQIGITIAILMIFISDQSNQIQIDVLTGINNRRGLHHYLNDYLSHHEGEELSILMIDINRFKFINDKYGHIVGDNALKDISEVLKKACSRIINPPFLCRYGGDEFVITGIGDYNDMKSMVDLIHTELNANNQNNSLYQLSVSIGYAIGKCTTMEDVEKLIAEADIEMYKQKTIEKTN